jgi:hypothetical protein
MVHDDPARLVRDDGATFAVLASHAAETLTLKPVLADGRALTTLNGDQDLGGVTLDPFGINVFKVTGSGPTAEALITTEKVIGPDQPDQDLCPNGP